MARLAFIFACIFATSVAFGASPSESALRAALQDLDKSDRMTPEAARQVHTEMDLYLRDALAKLGVMKSLYAMGSFDADPPLVYGGKKRKLDQFQATYEHGWIQWRVFVRPDGKIARLVPFSINAPGRD